MLSKELNQKSDRDLIIAHLTGSESHPLSEALEKKLERIDRAADLMKKFRGRVKVAPMLRKEFGVSKATAYHYIDEALEIYNVLSPPKGKQFWIDVLMDEVQKTKNLAIKKGDAKAAAACDKNLAAIIKEFFGDADTDLFENVEHIQVMLGFFPGLFNTKLPDNLDEELKKLETIKVKRKEKLLDDAEDVNIL